MDFQVIMSGDPDVGKAIGQARKTFFELFSGQKDVSIQSVQVIPTIMPPKMVGAQPMLTFLVLVTIISPKMIVPNKEAMKAHGVVDSEIPPKTIKE